MAMNVSRRGFLGAVGLMSIAGLSGLSGCGPTGVKGKTLYYISVCDNVALGKMTNNKLGSETTIPSTTGTAGITQGRSSPRERGGRKTRTSY